MGLREVRRLRGEVGRAIFFEEIEKDTFDKVFGTSIAEIKPRDSTRLTQEDEVIRNRITNGKLI
jgi:hypothetical protein